MDDTTIRLEETIEEWTDSLRQQAQEWAREAGASDTITLEEMEQEVDRGCTP